MAARNITGGASASPTLASIAAGFVAIGGRIMVDPRGRLTNGLSADVVYSLTIPEDVRTARLEAARAYIAAERRNRTRLAALVLLNGSETANGWIVWGSC